MTYNIPNVFRRDYDGRTYSKSVIYILAGYPELKKEDIQAALLYARASLDHTEIRAAYA